MNPETVDALALGLAKFLVESVDSDDVVEFCEAEVDLGNLDDEPTEDEVTLIMQRVYEAKVEL